MRRCVTDQIVEAKTKIIEKLDSDESGKLWSAKVPPYHHLVKITTKNRLTANDAAIDAEANVASDKTNQTCNIFRYLQSKEIPTAFVTQIDNLNFIARECEMFPYECVARRRAYGSFLKRNTKFFPGHIFGRGVGGVYQDPLVEFFYKHAVVPNEGSEPSIMEESRARDLYMRDGEWTRKVETDPLMVFSWTEWKQNGENKDSKDKFFIDLYPAKISQSNFSTKLGRIESVITPREHDKMFKLLTKTFMLLEEAWKKFDVELVDMKIEMGRDKNTGDILIADVIDNDSWRIWPGGDPNKQLDKQSFRDGESLSNVEDKYSIVTKYTEQF
jgi:phosphoribosylaminoimidazole-succinocarboxamide synthase